MPTTVQLARKFPFHKSEELLQDAPLSAERLRLAAWLETVDYGTLTATAVHAFVVQEYPQAVLERTAVWYEWVWDEEQQMYRLWCHDRGAIVYPPDGAPSPIQLVVVRSATY